MLPDTSDRPSRPAAASESRVNAARRVVRGCIGRPRAREAYGVAAPPDKANLARMFGPHLPDVKK